MFMYRQIAGCQIKMLRIVRLFFLCVFKRVVLQKFNLPVLWDIKISIQTACNVPINLPFVRSYFGIITNISLWIVG